ncbi:hypothetical protein WUBG_10210 [Wuchereria bancrofti]|uniref:Uncharacterized protein n=1 Tax=Wuchereria bancrofti TaxID=6293 RepID=J9EP94_WUCBA|nr:hypothetical protein WUBG_10210 [Wuchereria bancrofti]
MCDYLDKKVKVDTYFIFTLIIIAIERLVVERIDEPEKFSEFINLKFTSKIHLISNCGNQNDERSHLVRIPGPSNHSRRQHFIKVKHRIANSYPDQRQSTLAFERSISEATTFSTVTVI